MSLEEPTSKPKKRSTLEGQQSNSPAYYITPSMALFSKKGENGGHMALMLELALELALALCGPYFT